LFKLVNLDTQKLFQDLPAKLLSIALAFGLFFFNRLENVIPKTILAPLNLILPAELSPAENYPRRIRVLVRGPRERIEQIDDEDYEVFGETREDRGEGNYLIPLRLSRSGGKPPIEGIEANLEITEIRLTLEKSTTRVIEVRIPVIGNPESGYQLESIQASPPSVTVRGPRTRVNSLMRILSENLEISSRTESFSTRLQLMSPDPLVDLVSGSLVDVRVNIVPIIEEKEIFDLPVVFQGLADNLSVLSEPVLANLKIQGPQALVNQASPQTLLPTIDLSAIVNPGTYDLPIRWNLDPRLSILDQEPKTARVILGVR